MVDDDESIGKIVSVYSSKDLNTIVRIDLRLKDEGAQVKKHCGERGADRMGMMFFFWLFFVVVRLFLLRLG